MINPETQNKDRLTIRVNHDRKINATKIAEELGTDLPTLVNMFIARLVQENGMPFRPMSNDAVVGLDEALADVKAGRVTTFDSADAFRDELHRLEKPTDD